MRSIWAFHCWLGEVKKPVLIISRAELGGSCKGGKENYYLKQAKKS